jgi:hypothetical protein
LPGGSTIHFGASSAHPVLLFFSEASLHHKVVGQNKYSFSLGQRIS